MERPFDPDLLDLLESRQLHRWERTVWRQVFESTPPLRPNTLGARWSPPGVEALYCSLGRAAAEAELEYLAGRQPVPIRKRRTLYELDVRLSLVVDLQDLSALEPLGFKRSDLLADDDHALSRHIGDAVFWLECGGLLVPSARIEATNLVIFINNQQRDDYVREIPPGDEKAD
ncbi:MAG: RES domain-containing protein [Gemmatimonadota bacterium]